MSAAAPLRAELQGVVDALLAAHAKGAVISIDAIGDALGVRHASAEDIEKMFVALESAGRRIGAPQGQRGEASLKKVVAAARTLQAERADKDPNAKTKPTVAEIAARAQLTEEDVSLALALLRVMQR